MCLENMEELLVWCGVHVDVYTDHKSIRYVFNKKELNHQERTQLEFLKDYDMNVLYHQGKANVVSNFLTYMTMVSFSHVEEDKKDLVKDVHRLARFGLRFEYSPNGGFMVYHNSESS